MRLELHLFLWVTAGMAVLLQLSGSVRLPDEVSIGSASIRAQIVDENDDHAQIEDNTHPASGRVGSIDYDQSVRPMFTVIAAQSRSEPIVLAPEAVHPPPVLKGVLGGTDGRRAVFSGDPGTSELVIVSSGEVVADYRIEEIGEDFVTAVSPAGDEVRFELRGAGEGH